MPRFIERDETGLYLFYCPGCKCCHGVNEKWNVDYENNTIHPSVLVKSGDEHGPTRCHSFVKNGEIQYLSDCTHLLAGKTVPMEEI